MFAALRHHIRAYLGTDHLSRLEATMARITDALNNLVSQQQEASAAQLASFANLQSAVEQLRESAANGNLSDADQAAVDQLSEGFTTMIATANAADDTVVPPTTGGNVPAEQPLSDDVFPPVDGNR